MPPLETEAGGDHNGHATTGYNGAGNGYPDRNRAPKRQRGVNTGMHFSLLGGRIAVGELQSSFNAMPACLQRFLGCDTNLL